MAHVTAPASAADWIELDGAVNARAVVPGVLLRSDNLQDLTDADVRKLVDEHGVRVVVDLRTTGERVAEGPAPLDREPGVRVDHRSLYPESGGNTDLDVPDGLQSGKTADAALDWSEFEDRSAPLHQVLGSIYLRYLERRPDSVVEAVRAVAETDGAVLVHCAAGKDRTGTVVALALDAAGVDPERIVADYALTAERIEGIIARLCSTETYRAELEGDDPAEHAPRAETMREVLAALHEQGGGAAWLLRHGFSEDELARLRERLAPAV